MEMEGAQSRPPGKSVVWRGAIPPRRFSRGLFFGGIGAAVASTILLLWLSSLFSDIALKLSAVNWPVVPGVIQSNRARKSPGGKWGPDYRAEITYAYSVGTRNHTSQDVSPLAQFGAGQAAAQDVCDRYPVGRAVSVHYNFNKTYQTMLEPGFDWTVAAQLLFSIPPIALVGTAIAAWLALLIRRARGRAPGGLKAFSEPLPRLRTMWLSPICSGALSGGAAGWGTMILGGFLGGNLAWPITISAGLVVMLVGWIGVWRYFHLGNLRYRYDIMIDSGRQLLVLPGNRAHFFTIAMPQWHALVLSSELRSNGKGRVRYHMVTLVSKPEPDDSRSVSEQVYESTSFRDAREVAGWVSQHTGMFVVQRPDGR